MLDIISKKDFFTALDDHNVSLFSKSSPHDLKKIQDAYIFNTLKNTRDSKIIEIGGGNSRVLKALDRSNELWNIDEFNGQHGGPSTPPIIAGVKNVTGSLGNNIRELPSDYFDIVFSISVIEHIPSYNAIEAFFREGARIMKSGGVMHHAIDLYCQETPLPSSQVRINFYLEIPLRHGLSFCEQPAVNDNICFKCSYASNPDIAVYSWNKAVPNLSDLRLQSQSVSLKMCLIKK